MSDLLAPVPSFAGREEGAVLAEYVLLCVLIGLACIVAVAGIGTGVTKFFAGIPRFV